MNSTFEDLINVVNDDDCKQKAKSKQNQNLTLIVVN